MPDPSHPDYASSRFRPAADDRLRSALDLDRTVAETLTLTTVTGAEDYLVSDLTTTTGVVIDRPSPGAVDIRLHESLRGLYRCRLFSRAAIPLATPAEQEPPLQPLLKSQRSGVIGSVTSDREVRFRVGVADSAVRKQLIGRVQDELGWRNDPAQWDVNLTTGSHGWVTQIGALQYSRRIGRFARLPWSTNPLVAEVLIRLAKLTPGLRIHDPCCGTATLLIVAYQVAGGLLTGTDHDPGALAVAHTNLHRFNVAADLRCSPAVPFAANPRTLDRIVANLPFGKLVGSHEANTVLYPALLHEVARTLTPDGRAVLLTEDKRLFETAVGRTKGLKIIKGRLLRYSGATPTAYVVTRTRR